MSSRVTPPRLTFVALFSALALACGDDPVVIPSGTQLSAVDIDDNPAALERGTRDTLTATTVDVEGDTVDIPVVWRSSNERVATFERGGVLVAHDTGSTIVTAASLGVVSQGVQFLVVWQGPAYIDTLTWTRPHALTAGATLRTDSLSVRVINTDSVPVRGALVVFNITAGDGSVSPFIDTTDFNGVASTQWTLGAVGLNSVTATVVRADSTPDAFVEENAATFSITAYNALTVETGAGQIGEILSALPVPPSVRLVDSLGNPRIGVPVSFTANRGGRVTNTSASTNASGIASAGTWTLGDIPGEQVLEATVSDALVRITATATGTPIRYTATVVTTDSSATCARETDGAVKCWGHGPLTGADSTNDFHTPAPVATATLFDTVRGGSTHFCALTAAGDAWCWGFLALVDTSGATTSTDVPVEMPTDLTFKDIAPGFAHNCAIGSDDVAYCWGSNSSGQLGDGATATRFVPAPVSGGFTFSKIASGGGQFGPLSFGHSCALTLGGFAFCWGSNASGQLGSGPAATQRTTPTAVDGNRQYTQVGAGESFSCGLTMAGRVYCWGDVDGPGGAPANPTPFTYPDAPDFTSLSVGSQHACALTADGTAYCWGANGGNGQGRLGDNSTTNRAVPARVETDIRFSQISAGHRHSCGLSLDQGAVACWGRNVSGEVGNNTATFFLVPRYVVLGVTP